MADKTILFDAEGMHRTAVVVKTVEQWPKDIDSPNLASSQFPRHFWAKITGTGGRPDGEIVYSWQEVWRSDDIFVTKPSGRSGSLTTNSDGNYTYAINTIRSGAMIQVGTVVRMFYDYDVSGTAGSSGGGSGGDSTPTVYSFQLRPGGRLGQVVCAGPCSESDFTDNRYWVQILNLAAGDPKDPLSTYNDDAFPLECPGEDGSISGGLLPTGPRIVPVTHLAEGNKQTHWVKPGTLCYVESIVDTGVSVHYIVEYMDEMDNGQRCGSGSSSSSQSSSSHSGSASTNLVCVYAWDCTYTCGSGSSGSWGPVSNASTNCQVVPPLLNQWVLAGGNGCVYVYYTTGPSCPGVEQTHGCPTPPAKPAAPTFVPPNCCTSTSASASGSGSSTSTSVSAGSGGPTGKYVTDVSISGCSLTVTYSDGTTKNQAIPCCCGSSSTGGGGSSTSTGSGGSSGGSTGSGGSGGSGGTSGTSGSAGSGSGSHNTTGTCYRIWSTTLFCPNAVSGNDGIFTSIVNEGVVCLSSPPTLDQSGLPAPLGGWGFNSSGGDGVGTGYNCYYLWYEQVGTGCDPGGNGSDCSGAGVGPSGPPTDTSACRCNPASSSSGSGGSGGSRGSGTSGGSASNSGGSNSGSGSGDGSDGSGGDYFPSSEDISSLGDLSSEDSSEDLVDLRHVQVRRASRSSVGFDDQPNPSHEYEWDFDSSETDEFKPSEINPLP